MTSPQEDGQEGPSSFAERSGGVEEEPRLKYAPLCDETSPRAQSTSSTRLCVSSDGKVLALGHKSGAVVLLDCLGNQVRRGGGRGAALPCRHVLLATAFCSGVLSECNTLLPHFMISFRSRSSRSMRGR